MFLAKHQESNAFVAVKRCFCKRAVSPLRLATDGDSGVRWWENRSGAPTSRPPTRFVDPQSLLDDPSAQLKPPEGDDVSPLEGPLDAQNEVEMQEVSSKEVMALSQQERRQASACENRPNRGQQLHAAGSVGTVDEAMLLQYIGPHPHIVKYLGSYTTSHRVTFFAMELMTSDVARELRGGNTRIMSEEVCATILYSTLQALSHVHSRGIAHRDVKPGNVLVRRLVKDEVANYVVIPSASSPPTRRKSWQAEFPTHHSVQLEEEEEATNAHPIARDDATLVTAALGDFSAAHFVGQAEDSEHAAYRGTLLYKAPEQLLAKPIDDYTACDLWALGCTMFEMVTGTPAFPGGSELQVQLMIFSRLGSGFSEYPRQAAQGSLFDSLTASPPFVDLLRHLLELNPRRRYSARAALAHPFFAPLRHQIEKQRNDLNQGVPVQIAFSLPLVFSRCPDAQKLQVPFRPVASTPLRRQYVPQAYCKNLPGPPLSPAEALREPRPFHHSEEEHKGGEGDISGAVQHADVSSEQLYNTSSLYSDSLHWSQMRSSAGETPRLAEGGALFLERSRLSYGAAANGTSPEVALAVNVSEIGGVSGERLGGSRGVSRLVSASSAALAVARVLDTSDTNLTIHRASSHSGSRPSDKSTLEESSVIGEVNSTPVTCFRTSAEEVQNATIDTLLHTRRPPVLRLAAGATCTAGNMRTTLAFEAGVTRQSGSMAGTTVLEQAHLGASCSPCSRSGVDVGEQAQGVARTAACLLTFSDEKTSTLDRATEESEAGSHGGHSSDDSRRACTLRRSPLHHSRKALCFESPNPLGTSTSSNEARSASAAGTAGANGVTAGTAHAGEPTREGENALRWRRHARTSSSSVHAKEVTGCSPASTIEVHTPSHASDCQRSCCSTACCSPVAFFAPAAGTIASSTSRLAASMSASLTLEASLVLAGEGLTCQPPPPLPISLSQAAASSASPSRKSGTISASPVRPLASPFAHTRVWSEERAVRGSPAHPAAIFLRPVCANAHSAGTGRPVARGTARLSGGTAARAQCTTAGAKEGRGGGGGGSPLRALGVRPQRHCTPSLEPLEESAHHGEMGAVILDGGSTSRCRDGETIRVNAGGLPRPLSTPLGSGMKRPRAEEHETGTSAHH